MCGDECANKPYLVTISQYTHACSYHIMYLNMLHNVIYKSYLNKARKMTCYKATVVKTMRYW